MHQRNFIFPIEVNMAVVLKSSVAFSSRSALLIFPFDSGSNNGSIQHVMILSLFKTLVFYSLWVFFFFQFWALKYFLS